MPTSIRTRLLVSLLIVAVLSAGVLSWYFLSELESYGLRKLEERLGSEAKLAAVLAETNGMRDSDALSEALSGLELPGNSWLRIVDGNGIVIADSAGRALGQDFSGREEIAEALRDEYGADSRITGTGRLALFVAAPIRGADGRIIGAASSAANTFSIMTLVSDYRIRLTGLVLLFAAFTLIVAELLARWLSSPLRRLEAGAVAFAGGDHSARVRPSGSRETRSVAQAFNQMADEVQRALDELKAEERRKSQFVSDVSHELRSPLTAIRGMAETLADGDVPPADAQRFLGTIVREADRLARLADDLLTLQRIDGATGELPIRRVDPLEVSQRAAGAMEHLAEGRGVELRVTGTAPAVLGDPDRLQQVVANLLDNALRVMNQGGTITVALAHEGDWATISIMDEGPGIAEEDLARIFDRFYRAEPSRERAKGGAGLGLAIVRAIIERHAGRIEVANRPEGGTVFTVYLPALRG
ncbi:MAG: HAMP domain-containing protein [Actinobacteria bacterium]|nr:HAMP domain-containing protein [Actinomycetota bacterium]MCG2807810.1 ATP-binding protein [Coriobacteriia bacterium]